MSEREQQQDNGERDGRNTTIRVPWELWRARLRVWWRGYVAQLFRDLPAALTLGGIALSVGLSLEAFSEGTTYFLAVTLFFLVPLAHLLTLDQRRKALLVHQATKKDSPLALRHLAFHTHQFMKAASLVIRQVEESLEKCAGMNNPTERSAKLQSAARSARSSTAYARLEASHDYPHLLSEQLFEQLDFRTPYALLDFLRFHPARVLADLRAALDELEELASKWTASQLSKVRLAFKHFDKSILHFSATSHVDLIIRGQRIISTPGTSKAIDKLTVELSLLEGNGRKRELAELVDRARGFSLIDLADLAKWFEDPSHPLPELSAERRAARDGIVDRFREFLDSRRRGSQDALTVVTAGFSSAVLACLLSYKDRILQVFLIESTPGFRNENRQMHSRLEAADIPTAMIDLESAANRAFQRRIDFALFGFEVIDIQGFILHPRGVSDAFGAITSTNGLERVETVAVGESWKVRKSKRKPFDPSLVSIYAADALSAIVTGDRVHEPREDGTYDLSSSRKEWKETVKKAMKNNASQPSVEEH